MYVPVPSLKRPLKMISDPAVEIVVFTTCPRTVLSNEFVAVLTEDISEWISRIGMARATLLAWTTST